MQKRRGGTPALSPGPMSRRPCRRHLFADRASPRPLASIGRIASFTFVLNVEPVAVEWLTVWVARALASGSRRAAHQRGVGVWRMSMVVVRATTPPERLLLRRLGLLGLRVGKRLDRFFRLLLRWLVQQILLECGLHVARSVTVLARIGESTTGPRSHTEVKASSSAEVRSPSKSES